MAELDFLNVLKEIRLLYLICPHIEKEPGDNGFQVAEESLQMRL